MANTLGVCLLLVFCCANLSFARQLPKECSKGPTYWCQSLRIAADCGAVGHCSSTVWETKEQVYKHNEVADRFVRLFGQLKDVKDLINEGYLATRLESACHDVPYPSVASQCKENTVGLEQYVHHVLKSDASPQTLCAVVGICNNAKLDNLIASSHKKIDTHKKKNGLLGRTQCTWGPSYWCSNFSTSHECKATPHCASRVWPKMSFPEDTDSICKICTDMVTQARNQLQSNETQEELKQVFEGSCELIRIKIVRKECMKLADDFVPELVETLSSEMNPQTVCSVAGLCNNAKIDEMLIGYNEQLALRADCNNCSKTVGALRKRFDATSYEEFLIGLLQACRKMDSLSDSCSMIVFKYYENIIEAAKKDLTSDSVCHVSGQCSYRFHQHDDYDFPEETALTTGDDVPCELCEQLVKHLRDTLVANTTEIEFYKVLQGLCKQSGKFKDECLHLAEQYYPIIYEFLTKGLNPPEVCGLMGICTVTSQPTITLMLPEDIKASVKDQLIGNVEQNTYTVPELVRVPLTKTTNVRVIENKPPSDVAGVLPLERMLFTSHSQNKAVCSFCEYFLHYLQVELSDTNTIERVTEAVDTACDKLPKAVDGECKQFVDQYGPTVIALLVQEIDPASVCPAIGVCPQTSEVRRVAINAGASSCPLCLFAVEQLKAMLKDDRSEENIRKALDNLCTRLSTKLQPNCVDFVDTYTQQLVEMLAADLNSQEICVYLKLCKDEVKDPMKITHSSIDKFFEQTQLRGDRNNFKKHSQSPKHDEIETNEIPDDTVNGRPVKALREPKTVCVVCEFVMKELDEQIKDKHNDDEIMNAVHNICKHMPKSVRGECDQFVQKYGELVISLLAQELEPSTICAELKLCPKSSISVVKEEILDCAVCETVVMAVKKVLTNDKVDHDIVKVVEKSCGLLPAKYNARCHTMMEIYGDSVIHLIEQYGTKGVCQKIGLCSQSDAAYVRMYREKRN